MLYIILLMWWRANIEKQAPHGRELTILPLFDTRITSACSVRGAARFDVARLTADLLSALHSAWSLGIAGACLR